MAVYLSERQTYTALQWAACSFKDALRINWPTTHTMASVIGKASQIPTICANDDKRTAAGIITTKPRRMAMKDICLPKLGKASSVRDYIRGKIELIPANRNPTK